MKNLKEKIKDFVNCLIFTASISYCLYLLLSNGHYIISGIILASIVFAILYFRQLDKELPNIKKNARKKYWEEIDKNNKEEKLPNDQHSRDVEDLIWYDENKWMGI